MKDLVINKWLEIWKMDLDRRFTADFEVFGENTCFCYKKKMFCYLWTDKKTDEPYLDLL